MRRRKTALFAVFFLFAAFCGEIGQKTRRAEGEDQIP